MASRHESRGPPFNALPLPPPQTGWKHLDLIKRLEAQRKEASAAFYAKKKEATRRVSAARAAATAA